MNVEPGPPVATSVEKKALGRAHRPSQVVYVAEAMVLDVEQLTLVVPQTLESIEVAAVSGQDFPLT